jgi:hypothetical protein
MGDVRPNKKPVKHSTFDEALPDFLTFCQKEGVADPKIWLRSPYVLADRRRAWILHPEKLDDITPHRALYAKGLERDMNVSIEHLGTCDGIGVASVDVPSFGITDHGDSGSQDYKIVRQDHHSFRGVSSPLIWQALKLYCRIKKRDSWLRYSRFPE